jgi:3-deoxy-D-manno-octulosonic-acid transferase
VDAIDGSRAGSSAGGLLARPRGAALWANRLVRLAEDVVVALSLPFLVVAATIASRFWTRPKFRRGFWRKIAGFPRIEGEHPVIWIHAVSVGEVLIAEPLVRELRARLPGHEIVASVSTFTGFDVAESRLAGGKVFYAPFDVSPCVGLAFRRIRPIVLVLVELEVWPNLILTARARGVPVVIVNGRLSERSTEMYARLGILVRALFRQISAVAAQNDVYAARFRRLGVPERSVRVLGNIKHDRSPRVLPDEIAALRASLLGAEGATAIVFVAGCTHAGEEAIVARVVRRSREAALDVRLIIAPRHIERLAVESPASWGIDRHVRWSAIRAGGPTPGPRALDNDFILIVDTIGELELFYGIADVVFVGGSLVPRGGHNVLEPARLAKAVLTGPHTANFRDEVEDLVRHRALAVVESEAGLERELGRLARDAGERSRIGERALAVTLRMSGALERQTAWMLDHIHLLRHARRE